MTHATGNARARVAWSLTAVVIAAALLSAAVAPARAAAQDAVTCPTVDINTGAVTPAPTPGVDWAGCDLNTANLANADLAGSNLDGAYLIPDNLTGANLTNATLVGATAEDALFSGATLNGADLSSARLIGAGFKNASLPGANLAGANAGAAVFDWANLRGANLQNVNLVQASLYGTNLLGATLTGAIGDSETSWTEATCPDGTLADYHANGCLGPVNVTTPSDNAVITAGTRGNNGWWTSPVTVTWYWADSNTMLAAKCPASTVSKGQGAITAITATCTDAAGHVGTGAVYAPIDTTPPVVTVTGVSNGAAYSLHNYPASPQCKATDAVSSVAKKAVASFTLPPVKSAGHPGTAGVWSISCSGAYDKAGNKASMAHATWTVRYEFGGFSAPRANSTLSHTVKAITVHMSLADGNGRPIAGSEQAAWAARHAFRVRLTASGVTAVTAACTWNASGRYLQCSIPMPGKAPTGHAHPYRITAQQNLGSGWLTILPAVHQNPETIYLG